MGSCRGQGSNSRGRGMKEYQILKFTSVDEFTVKLNRYASQGYSIKKYETYLIGTQIWYSILMERDISE